MRINTIAPPISGIPNSDTLKIRLNFVGILGVMILVFLANVEVLLCLTSSYA